MAKRLNSSGNVVTVFKIKWWSQTALKEARDNWTDKVLSDFVLNRKK